MQRLFDIVPGNVVVDLPISLQLFIGGIQRFGLGNKPGELRLRMLHVAQGLLSELGVAIESGVADALARSFAIAFRIGLAFTRHRCAYPSQVWIRVLRARDMPVRFLGFSHLLKRDDMLLLLGNGRSQQLLGLAGRIVQRVVEPALDGCRAFAGAKPGVQAGVGKGDRDNSGHHIHADQQRTPAGISSGRRESDQPCHQHERGLDADRGQRGEPDG